MKVASDLELLERFLDSCNYDKKDLIDIRENFKKDMKIPIFRQIYAELGLISNEENEYYQILKFLKRNFDLGCNVLEICGGHYPILSKYIDIEQTRIQKGTITVYDPKLAVSKLGNIKLVKEDFSKKTDISKYDLIVSQFPCDLFDDIVDSAVVADKDYFIALCDCIYKNYSSKIDLLDWYFFEDYDPVIDILYSHINTKERSQGHFDNLDTAVGSIDVACGSPIKYIKRKKIL